MASKGWRKKANAVLLNLFPKGEDVWQVGNWILVKEQDEKSKGYYILINKKVKIKE